jgi:hypothetical protein
MAHQVKYIALRQSHRSIISQKKNHLLRGNEKNKNSENENFSQEKWN